MASKIENPDVYSDRAWGRVPRQDERLGK